ADTTSPSAPDILNRLRDLQQETARDLPHDPWWRGIFAEASVYAQAMAQEVAQQTGGFRLQTEQTVAGDHVRGTCLQLKGRVDLMMQSADENELRIIDFKTGKPDNVPKLNTILKPDGAGLQFAAYLWLLASKARQVTVGAIDREGSWHQIVTQDDLTSIETTLQTLAQVRAQGIFAQRAFADSHNHNKERLPFACPPFSERLLETKRRAGQTSP
ncbi:MAG: PD-(D/E)XK nuclease family protein, partial [Verrucomicrobiia bacterium]